MKRILVLSLSLAVSAFAGSIDWTSIWMIDRPDFNPVWTGKKTPPTLTELYELRERFAPETLAKELPYEFRDGVLAHSVTSTTHVVRTVTTTGETYGGFVEWFKADKVSLTNTVNDLAKAGLLCEVIGHRWEHGCGVEASGFGCLVNHGPARHCSVCNKEQYKKPEEWE